MDSSAGLLPRSRLHSLTGARFFAAFLVFLFHVATLKVFAPATGIDRPLTLVTKSAGTIGVSFFFLLSGFVLTWSARPGDTYRAFVRRRIVKIYPNHLVTFALAMVVFAAASTPPVVALSNVLLLHAWVPNPGVFLSVNGPSWSLSCEIFFYALFPLLLPLVNRIAVRRLWWWAGSVSAVVMLLPLAAGLLPVEPEFPSSMAGTALDGQSIYHLWFLYVLPPVRLLEFILGMLIARIVMADRWINIGITSAVLLTVLGYGIGVSVPMVYTIAAVTVLPLGLLIGAVATADARGHGWFLAKPVIRRLGEVSFAFYLVHEIVLIVVRAVVGFDRQLGTVSGLLFVAMALGLSLCLAFLLHSLVETPAVRRWGRFRKAAAEPHPAAGPVTAVPGTAGLAHEVPPRSA